MSNVTIICGVFIFALSIFIIIDIYKDRERREFNPIMDFESRCEICGKRLKMGIQVINKHQILLVTLGVCKEHPGQDIILWGQRDDVDQIWLENDVLNLGNYFSHNEITKH